MSEPATSQFERRPAVSVMQRFRELAETRAARDFADFEDLHQWSVAEPAKFWQAVCDFDGIASPTPAKWVLDDTPMPGTRWFTGAQVNYAHHVFRHVAAADAAGQPAIIAEDERGSVETLDWATLKKRASALAIGLRERGVVKGDRVVAYLPNRPEAIVAFLACASIGAVWAICAPDMGVPAVLERFKQIAPRVLIATDGVWYAGKVIDRVEVVRELRAALPSVETLLLVRSGYGSGSIRDAVDFHALVATRGAKVDAFEPDWLPFDHPLWIVYSSGTTGKPKALVHGHGGILLGVASGRLHLDLRASYDAEGLGERFHWYSSTGWMMWNTQVGGLLNGTTICIFDGSPSGAKDAPDWSVLWRFAARNKVTFFGSGAQFYTVCAKASLDLATVGSLGALRALGSTASPLPAAIQTAVSAQLADAGRSGIWWFNSSGGTDICGAFCAGNIDRPPAPGKLQCRQLGAAVEAWSADGRPVVGEVGELVCVKPLPNMPLFIWGDDDGSRFRDSYFSHYPGVWRHGDWLRLEADGTCEILGRSDATINRGGHRMGSSEIYAAVENVAGVSDSLVVDVRARDADSQILLFVVPAPDADASALTQHIKQAVRASLSPRFVPDQVMMVTAVPRTLSSKKQELPIKRLFEGASLSDVIDPAAMANPECLDEYVGLAGHFKNMIGSTSV